MQDSAGSDKKLILQFVWPKELKHQLHDFRLLFLYLLSSVHYPVLFFMAVGAASLRSVGIL